MSAAIIARCHPLLLLQGAFEDPTILFVGEPELVELKLVEGQPMVVVQFACQQIKCTRDKFGNVVDGNPNSIQVSWFVFFWWGSRRFGEWRRGAL